MNETIETPKIEQTPQTYIAPSGEVQQHAEEVIKGLIHKTIWQKRPELKGPEPEAK